MKIILTLICLAGLSGCALLSQPPSEAKARRLEEGRREQEKSSAINARTGDYMKQGLNRREAQALAETEYAKSGKR